MNADAILLAEMEFSLRRVCMYCGDEFGRTPCEPALHDQATHGVCQPCFDVTTHLPELCAMIDGAGCPHDLLLAGSLYIPTVENTEWQLALRRRIQRREQFLQKQQHNNTQPV